MEILLTRQTCGHCGSGTPMWSDVCGQCGTVIHSARRLRAAGVLYMVLGLILSGAAAYLLTLITGRILGADDPEKVARLSESAWTVLLAYGTLGFVLVLGVTGILMGAWQIRHGRRKPKLVRVVIILYLIFMACAALIRVLS
jgi:uncharacterized membrane protein YsdA (DUF1294 family)